MRKGKAEFDGEKIRDHEGQTGEQRMQSVENRSNKKEGEFDRLSDSGQERCESGRNHETADQSTLFGLGGMPNCDRRSRKSEHFKEESTRKNARSRIARKETRNLSLEGLTHFRVRAHGIESTVDAGFEGFEILTDFKEEGDVPDVMETKRNQGAFDDAVDAARENRILGRCPVRKDIDAATNRRPNKAQGNTRSNRRKSCNNRNKAFAREEAEIRGKLDLVVAIEHVGRDHTRDDAAHDSGVDRVDTENFLRRNTHHFGHGAKRALKDNKTHDARKGSDAVVVGESECDTDRKE
jgi:hypothetical protein